MWSFFRHCCLLAALLIFGICTAHADPIPPLGASNPTAQTDPVVAKIYILKSARRMDLLDIHGNIIKSYKIALGTSPVGPKVAEGDGKTPEGTYYIDGRNEKSDYDLSFRISYPSPSDVQKSRRLGVKPGGDIFIHGTPNDRSWMFWKYNTRNDWTFGCIAVDDHDIEEMWKMVPEGTLVQIDP